MLCLQSFALRLGTMPTLMIASSGPQSIDDLLATVADGLNRADLAINHAKTTIWCLDGDETLLSSHAKTVLHAQPRVHDMMAWLSAVSRYGSYERHLNTLQAVAQTAAQCATVTHIAIVSAGQGLGHFLSGAAWRLGRLVRVQGGPKR